MCSITGFTWEDRSLLKNMADIVRYRGPDDHGYYHDKYISLGHRRLSIVDLSDAGHQPMSDKEGTVTIVFNGEIYNHKELRSQLEPKYDFASNSDTEVLIYGYKQWGPDGLLKRLNGMFAFAIWDSVKRRLFLARDRVGIKPLYYSLTGDGLVFASELKSVLQCPAVAKVLDRDALASYLSYRFIPGEKTVLKGIKKLLPGHFLLYGNGHLIIRKYWDLSFVIRHGSEQFFLKRFKSLLRDSVDKRLMSDVPLGAYLSGGLDSSLIVAINSVLRDDPVKTFTVGFGHETDEFKHAKVVAEHLNTDHHELVLDYKDMTKALPKIIWYMDEPNSDITMVPLYFLSRFSRKKVTVVNTGEGADELFSGYPHFNVGSSSFRFVPKSIRKNIYSLYYSPFKSWERKQLFTRNVLSDDSLRVYLSRDRPKDFLNRILLFDIKNELPNWQLARVDRMTMAHSQEARVPFLDHRMVEFSATVPVTLKLRSLDGKYLLKKAARSFLPKRIVSRKKQGFTTPRDAWFKSDFLDISFNILSEEAVRSRGLFDASYVAKLKHKVRTLGDRPFRPYTYKFLILTMFEMWMQMYLDSDAKVLKIDDFLR